VSTIIGSMGSHVSVPPSYDAYSVHSADSAAAPGRAQVHRYWRLLVTADAPTGWEGYVSRLEMHAPTSAVPASAPTVLRPVRVWALQPPPELETREPASALSHEQGVSFRTLMAPGAAGDFIAMEYAAPVAVDRVTFTQFHQACNAFTAVALQWSDDGAAWTTRFTASGLRPGEFDSARHPLVLARAGATSAEADPRSLPAYEAARAAEEAAASTSALAALALEAAQRQAALESGQAHAGSGGAAATSVASVLLAPPPGAGWTVPFIVERQLSYVPNIAAGGRVTVYAGPRVAMVVADGARAELGALEDVAAMAWIVDRLQALRDVFDDVVGRQPTISHPVRLAADQRHDAGAKRVAVEIAYIPAGGLAAHGVAGIAVGPRFLKDVYDAAVRGGMGRAPPAPFPAGAPPGTVPFLHHVFFYESTRNYIFPEEFTALFDYELTSERPDCWGWVNQGFVNVLGCLVATELPVPFFYYGQGRAEFMASMEAELQAYVDGPYAWEDVFMREMLPWKPTASLDNAYSGVVVRLWREAGGGDAGGGGAAWLRRFFRVAIPLLLQPRWRRRPASKRDVATARDNFYLAASVAAGRDLASLFATRLHWIISEHAAGAVVHELLAVAAAAAPPPRLLR
jgi:hypothetical protein